MKFSHHTFRSLIGTKQVALCSLLLLIIAPLIMSSTVSAEPGSESNPYPVTNCEDLASIQFELDAFYQLQTNLVCNDINPIGFNDPFPDIFTGGFDGNGFRITYSTNETLADAQFVGLFAAIGYGASIENLSLLGSAEGYQGVGGVSGVGIMPFTVSNITSSVTLRGTESVGGIIGQTFSDAPGGGTIEESTYDGDIIIDGADLDNAEIIGGIVGGASGSETLELLNVSFSGSISADIGTVSSVGGIIGSIENVTTMESISDGVIDITAVDEVYDIGGIVGRADDEINVLSEVKSVSEINVSSENIYTTAGIIGSSYITTISDSYANADITVTGSYVSSIGGFSGYAYLSDAERSYAAGTINFGSSEDVYGAGGAFGESEESHVTDSFSAVTFDYGEASKDQTAGMIGEIYYFEGDSEVTPQETMTGVVYDAYKADGTICAYDSESNAIEDGCVSVNLANSNPNYFINNSSNTPMSAWDFENTWLTTTTYPELRIFYQAPTEPTEQLPNGGDLNDDGVVDSEQQNVESFKNSITDKYVAVAFDEECSIDSTATLMESENSLLDPAFEYSDGFITFSTQCTTSEEEPVENPPSGPGDGSELNPYTISDCSELRNIETNMDDHYVLTSDLVCDEFDPIGSDVGISSRFNGSLDGNDFTISLAQGDVFGGLFIGLGEGASVTNLRLDGIISADAAAGALAVIADGGNVIENVHSTVDVTVSGDSAAAGGLIGFVEVGSENSTIRNCTVDAAITVDIVSGFGLAGGVFGSVGSTDITNCSFTGSLNVTSASLFTATIGGFVGDMYDSNFDNISVGGAITINTDNELSRVGGVVGSLSNFETINDVESNVTLTIVGGAGVTYVGGLYGEIGTGLSDTATLTQQQMNGTIDITATEYIRYVGGAIGYSQGGEVYSENAAFDHIFSNVDMTLIAGEDVQSIGGLIGLLAHYEISHSSAEGSILLTAGTDSDAIGGFAGNLLNLEGIADLYAEVDIDIDNANTATYEGIGGFSGILYNSTAENIYASGSVDVEYSNDISFVGGLVGVLQDNSQLTNSFAATQIIWKTEYPFDTRGAIVGNIDVEGSVDTVMVNVFYDDTRSQTPQCALTDDGVTEVSTGCTAENIDSANTNIFRSNNTDDPLDTWDFENVWVIRTNDYPAFRGIAVDGYDPPVDPGTDIEAFTATVKLYYYGSYREGLYLRKHLPDTNAYFTINDAVLEEQIIDGVSVLVVTYTITDGGVLDIDGEVNGVIVDPAGVGSLVLGAPNTGIKPSNR